MRIEKPRAIALRRQGMSYSLISQEIGVSKSTLSNWLRDVPYTPNQEVRMRIKNGQGMYGLHRRRVRIDEVARLRLQGISEIGNISKRDLWMIGVGLWLGEGSKTMEQIRLVNSDPRVIKLFVRWLREICELDDDNITAAMHLYPDSDEQASRRYWVDVTAIPEAQFRKTQVDRRIGKRKLKEGKTPYGTLHVTVASGGDPDKGVKLYRRMMGWVSGVVGEQHDLLKHRLL